VRLRLLVLALALFSLLAPAAGAIYIPGQEIPDDGLFHIMSAGESPGETKAPERVYTGISLPSLMPPDLPVYGSGSGPVLTPTAPEMAYSGDKPVISIGHDSILREANSIPPFVPGGSQGRFVVPAIDLPYPDREGNIRIGDSVGHIAEPPAPGYWDNLEGMDLHTNMPVLCVPALFG